MRYKKIGPAVAVVISKGGSRGPSGIAAQSSGFGHIRECPVAVVTIKDHSAETRHEEIRPAIIVVVANYGSHGPARIAYASLIGNIGKGSVVIVMVESASGFSSVEGHLNA